MAGAVGFRGAWSLLSALRQGLMGTQAGSAVPGAALFLSSAMATVSKNTKNHEEGREGHWSLKAFICKTIVFF